MRGKVAHEYEDSDGYWIVLNAGWKSTGGEHAIVEGTKMAAHTALRNAMRCDCEQCEEIKAESKAEQRGR